ncbi:Fmp27 GFWDK and Apt1 and Zip domain containing pr otein [Trichuris trichiura]|uniref:Fmp27 GFWDK and Apt1 and Zip domain containing pr otein n=1 Tax=Trichuris trichiura TaxID=36087 RepID=A0A077Z2X8_TRITR|nr:Fmp27 GFWDK and Apt1 and Zip domain containing pr otein [Trichuris trichiura]
MIRLLGLSYPNDNNGQDATSFWSIAHVKLLLIVCLLVVTLGSSLFPLLFRRIVSNAQSLRIRQQVVTIFSLLSCFGGGVFLGTSLLDLLPDTREELLEAADSSSYSFRNFPLAEFFTAIGFSFILCIEQLAIHAKWTCGRRASVASSNQSNCGTAGASTCEGKPLLNESHRQPSYSSVTNEEDVHEDPMTHSWLRAIILVLTLSIHALFEGLAMGLIGQYTTAFQIFAALCIHRSLVAFSLGLRLISFKDVSTCTVILFCTAFAAVGSLGGFIGIVLSEALRSKLAHFITGSLQGIACGTFLYIVTFEILPHELSTSTAHLLPVKLIFFLAGLGTIAFVLYYASVFFYGRLKVKITALLHCVLRKMLRCENVACGNFGFVSLSRLSIRYEGVSLVWQPHLLLQLYSRALSGNRPRLDTYVVLCLNYVRVESSLCDLRLHRNSRTRWSNPWLKSIICQCMKVVAFEVGSVNVALLDTFPGFLLHATFEDISLYSAPLTWNLWQLSCYLKLFNLKVLERLSAESPSVNYLNIVNRLTLTLQLSTDDLRLKLVQLECYSPVASFSSGFANVVCRQMEKRLIRAKFGHDGSVSWTRLLSSTSFELMISRPLVRFSISGQRNLQLMLSHLSVSADGSLPKTIQVQLSDLLLVESKLDMVSLATRRLVCNIKLDPSCHVRSSMELFVDCARVCIDYEDFLSCLTCVAPLLSGYTKMNQSKGALLGCMSVRLVYSFVQVGLPDDLLLTFQFACIYFVKKSPIKSEFGLHTFGWHIGAAKSEPATADFKNKSATHKWGWSVIDGACVFKLHHLFGCTFVQAYLRRLDLECRIEWIRMACRLFKAIYKAVEKPTESACSPPTRAKKYAFKLNVDEISIFIPLFQFEACCLFRFTSSSTAYTPELSTFFIELAECYSFSITTSTEDLKMSMLQEERLNRSYIEAVSISCWRTDYWNVKVSVKKSSVLYWSPSLHMLLYKTFSTFAKLSMLLSQRKKSAKAASRDGGSAKRAFWKSSKSIISFNSTLQVNFRLPEDHNLEFKLPEAKLSLKFGNPSIEANSLVISCDSHPVFNLTGVCIEKVPSYPMFNVLRQYIKVLMSPRNSCWIWSIKTLAIVFPYGYHFNAIHEQIINAWKWVKSLRSSGRLLDVPVMWSDWHIKIGVTNVSDPNCSYCNTVSIEICDDPFEVKLRDNYTLMVDEYFEAENRAAILRSRIEEQCLAGSLTAQPDLNDLFACLSKRSSSIYIQRSQKLYKGLPSRTSLFRCSFEAMDLKVFADINFLGETRLCQQIRSMDPSSPWPDQPHFQTLWCRYVDLNFNEMFAQMRDYPLPYMDIKDGRVAGRFAGCEMRGSERSKFSRLFAKFTSSLIVARFRTVNFALGHKFGFSTLERHIGVLKYFYDFSSAVVLTLSPVSYSITIYGDVIFILEFKTFRWSYGPCWEPCLAMINSCLALIRRRSLDPSPPLPFWDKARLLFHGRLRLLSNKLVLALLASSDPYNDTEQLEWTWEKLLFEWKSGKYYDIKFPRHHLCLICRKRAAEIVKVRRLLSISFPQFETQVTFFVCSQFRVESLFLFSLRFDWSCIGNPYNHNAVSLCAPDKLPDRSADQRHDSYGAFRSQHLNLTFIIDVHEKRECTDSLRVLLYSNTFRWLVRLRDTVSAINRPVKRGSLYSNMRTPKSQLSRHYKKLNISISLPKFLVTYWPSFTSDRGVHFTCSALQLSSAHELHLEDFTSSELLYRRKRTKIRTTFLNARMSHVDCYLLGNCPDHCVDEKKSFFVGIDRLTYCRDLIDFNGVPVFPILLLAIEDVTVHHVVVRNVKAIWTTFNRDIALHIYDNIEKGKIIRRNLSTDALKLVIDNESDKALNAVEQKKQDAVAKPFCQTEDGSIKLLQKLIEEANTKSVAYCEEVRASDSDRKRHDLTGIQLCQEDDVLFSKWQSMLLLHFTFLPLRTPLIIAVELISMQVALKGCDTTGYILCTAAHGRIVNKIHQPIWRANQLLGKSTWVTRFTGMQYFATVNPGDKMSKTSSTSTESFRANSDVSEFKFLDIALLNSDAESPGRLTNSARQAKRESKLVCKAERSSLPSVSPTDRVAAFAGNECPDHQWETNDGDFCYIKTNSLPFDSQWLSSLDQVQWLGKDLIEESFSSDRLSDVVTSVINEGDSAGGVIPESSLRDASLQRVISRCSCELMVCCFTENFEPSELGILHVSARECDGITECDPDDCVTLIHPKLDIHTSYDQYSMILDVVNNLILYVDPNKKKSAENLLKFRFKMQLQSLDDLRPYILSLQNEVRILWAQNRDIELAMYHMHPLLKDHPELVPSYLELSKDLEESKANLSLKNEDLHIAIRELFCFADLKSAVARRFEVSIEEAQWCLTEANGQLGLAQLQLENFLYTKVSRINDSGEHMFELNSLKIINLLPNSPFMEVLQMQESHSATHKPAVLVVCRELAPGIILCGLTHCLAVLRFAVGGITVLEHLEVSVRPMIVQMTYIFFHTMMKFFFPDRNIETAEESVRNETGSVTHRKKKKHRRSKVRFSSFYFVSSFAHISFQFAIIRKSMMPKKRKLTKEPGNYIDLMKLRAMKNILFMNVRVNEVPIVVTYKGASNGYIDNFKNFELTFPLIEYHNQNWTWLDLAVGIKAKSLRVLLKQVLLVASIFFCWNCLSVYLLKVVRRKLMKPRLADFFGGRKAESYQELRDEDKKRMILALTTCTVRAIYFCKSFDTFCHLVPTPNVLLERRYDYADLTEQKVLLVLPANTFVKGEATVDRFEQLLRENIRSVFLSFESFYMTEDTSRDG